MKVLVTGGSGFIGSAVIRHFVGVAGIEVVNLDKLTYAACPEALSSVEGDPRYRFEQVDVCDPVGVRRVLEAHRPDGILHLAAETHVDRSIDAPAEFIRTNVLGTSVLLEQAMEYYRGLSDAARERFRFHHVSTDEVFGSLTFEEPAFTEQSPYRPSSPYSASKAAADHLVRAWHHTFGLPTVISNCSNNYGPYQFPEKLIPLMIIKALAGERLPVYGKGENVRDWLHVDDHARALLCVFERGRVGESYNIGGRAELQNLELVGRLCDLLDQRVPDPAVPSRRALIEMVPDRPGHDLRYAIDSSKIERELGWTPQATFDSGLSDTVTWYVEHADWWRAIQARRYSGQRLGMARS